MRSLGQFVVFLSVALSIVGGWQYYLWVRLVRDTALPKPLANAIAVALVLVTLSPFAVVFASRYLSRPTVKALALALYGWFGFAFLLGLALFAADLARLVWQGFAMLRPGGAPDDADRRKLLARGVAGAAGV